MDTITNPTAKAVVKVQGSLNQIKSAFNLVGMPLTRALDKAGSPTEWLRYWDDSRRLSISLHQDTVAHIRKNEDCTNLGLQHEIRIGEKGEYDSYRIVAYSTKDIEVTL